ncbi:MAG: DNA-directed RNA polymerase subunit alpha [Bacilli bacterium]|nr:DNA-directed RNA polymerase subunit alpha [Bacilli bacterium]
MKAFQNIEFVENDYDSTKNYGKFVLAPLERGFGITIGNAMRRVLISSIPGASVFAIEVEGARHEFSALEGVVEDVTAIVLNLKGLVLKIDSEDEKSVRVMSINVKGPATVTAADIDVPSDVEVVNPELVIAHVAEGGQLNMTLQANKGRGYLTNEQNKQAIENYSIGVIPVDSNYSPIIKVNYTTEPTRVEDNTNYDKLILEVWTNGAITPHDGVALAAKILIDHLEKFVNISESAKDVVVFNAEVEKPKDKYEDMSIEELDFSVRSYNCLKRAAITTVSELCNKTEEEMMKVRNLGKKSLKEVKDKLAELGLSFRQN